MAVVTPAQRAYSIASEEGLEHQPPEGASNMGDRQVVAAGDNSVRELPRESGWRNLHSTKRKVVAAYTVSFAVESVVVLEATNLGGWSFLIGAGGGAVTVAGGYLFYKIYKRCC